MATSILHITNGDSTTNYLKKIQLKGDFITWREMLCEGKTATNVGSEGFWKTRFEFLNKTYQVTKETFIDFTLKEYRTLCQHKKQNEIVLWFEHDLFCQINMLAVLSWVKRHRKNYAISLVNCGDVEGLDKRVGFSELTKDQLLEHYKNRVLLKEDDIEYGDYMWQLYCSDSPLRLETIYKFNPMSPFIYLSDALEAHFKRFPSIENGLNTVENYILKTADSSQIKNENELLKNLLTNEQTFGYGDTQYKERIQKLKSLFTSFNPVKLNKKGKQVLENQINYYRVLRDEHAYLGGVRKYSFLYQNSNNKLLKITS